MGSKIKFSQAKIVGTPTSETWAQVFVFEKESREKTSKIGTLFGVIAVKEIPGNEAAVIGKQTLASLQEEYESLKGEKRLKTLKEILERETQKENGPQIELTVCLLCQDALYLAASGGGGVILKRKDKIVPLFQTPQDETIKMEPRQEWGEHPVPSASRQIGTGIRSASGFIQENDIVILETSKFASIIDLTKLQEALDNRTITEVADILAPQILNSEESQAAAAILLDFKKQELTEEEEETEVISQETQEEIPEKKQSTYKVQKSLKKFLEKVTTIFSPKASTFPSLPKNGEEKSRRTLRTIALILLLLLGGAILFNVKKQQTSREKTKIVKTLETAKLRFEEGESLVDLNPIRAKTLLEDAQKTIKDTQKTLKKGTKEEKELKTFLDQIENTLNLAAKVYNVTPQIFFDLTIVKEKAAAQKLSSFQKNIFLLDSQNNTVYLFNTEKKSAEIIAGGEKVKGITLLALYRKNAFLFHPTNGVSKVDIETKTSPKVVIKKNEWGEIKDLAAYAGNLYLLDSKKNQIWKYIAGEEGFSDMRNYLTTDTTPDFSKAVSLTIDGSVWILRNDGEILKFTQGRIDNFSTSGLDQSLNNPSHIFTNDDLKNIYILDGGNKRIVVLAKDGTYQAQYQADIIANSQDFAVDEEAKKIFLLVGSKIYSIDLK